MKKTISKIKRKLPKPIKDILIGFYDKWGSRVRLDKGMIKNLEEYFKLSYEQTLCMLKLGTKLHADLWRILEPRTEKEIQNFYAVSPYGVFNLAYWHMQNHQRRSRRKIIKISQGDILDYGAGIGDLSLELARKGFNVDYADVEGKNFDFAKWLFQKNNSEIEMIDLTKNKLSKKYNTIICIDVIEHVPNPKMVLRELVEHLKENGRLIITALKSQEISETYPMHFKIEFDAGKYLNSIGVFKSDISKRLWVKTKSTS